MATIEAVPRRPHVAVTLRFPPDLHARLAALAERDDRTFTAEVFRVLREWVEEQERERPEQEQPDAPPVLGPNERRGTFTGGRSPGTPG